MKYVSTCDYLQLLRERIPSLPKNLDSQQNIVGKPLYTTSNCLRRNSVVRDGKHFF